MAAGSPRQPKVYVLDTSIVNLILDGELWAREPATLVEYKKGLQALLFHSGSERKTLSDLERESDYLQKAMNAWRWAERVVKGPGGAKLLLTPTVQAELSDALQVCTNV